MTNDQAISETAAFFSRLAEAGVMVHGFMWFSSAGTATRREFKPVVRAVATALVPVAAESPDPRQLGYTGNSCRQCQSARMVRNGSCEKCLDCGDTSGCS